MSALDVPEPQVAVWYGDGIHGYCWRLLLFPLDRGQWACATAAWFIHQIDLNERVVVLLMRGVPFPVGVLNDISYPLSPGDQVLDQARLQARALASVLVVAR